MHPMVDIPFIAQIPSKLESSCQGHLDVLTGVMLFPRSVTSFHEIFWGDPGLPGTLDSSYDAVDAGLSRTHLAEFLKIWARFMCN